MTSDDAAAVARLHVMEIPDGFLSSLGPGVLQHVYRALPRTDEGFGFVVGPPDDLLGFVTCATQLKRLYRGILGREGIAMAIRMLPRMFRPRAIRHVFQTLLYPGKATCMGYPDAEILSVVTSPAARGRGIGRLLMDAALAEFARRGCVRVKVLVGANLEPANAYYRKCGFELAGAIEHHERAENIYVIDLKSDSHSDNKGTRE
jgi:ribosomal protein S18 acetylase RimI-like enzyme